MVAGVGSHKHFVLGEATALVPWVYRAQEYNPLGDIVRIGYYVWDNADFFRRRLWHGVQARAADALLDRKSVV